MSTVIVDDPPKTAEGRTRILRPNGSFAWIKSSEIWSVACSKRPSGTLFGCSDDERDLWNVRKMMWRAARVGAKAKES